MLFITKKLSSSLQLWLSGLLLFNLAFGNMDSLASECGVLKLQKNRSQGATVTKNNCANANDLSLEAILEIQAGGRLWLETLSTLENAANFQIICQNKSSVPLNIKINSAILPWIHPEGVSQCDWANDRLECNESSSDKKALFCAIAQVKKPPVNQTMERSTSVIMRGLKHSNKQKVSSEFAPTDINQWATYLTPEVDLCRKVFQSSQPITLSWTINTIGKATDATIKESGIDNQLADCAIEVIENFSFPMLSRDTQITYSF